MVLRRQLFLKEAYSRVLQDLVAERDRIDSVIKQLCGHIGLFDDSKQHGAKAEQAGWKEE